MESRPIGPGIVILATGPGTDRSLAAALALTTIAIELAALGWFVIGPSARAGASPFSARPRKTWFSLIGRSRVRRDAAMLNALFVLSTNDPTRVQETTRFCPVGRRNTNEYQCIEPQRSRRSQREDSRAPSLTFIRIRGRPVGVGSPERGSRFQRVVISHFNL